GRLARALPHSGDVHRRAIVLVFTYEIHHTSPRVSGPSRRDQACGHHRADHPAVIGRGSWRQRRAVRRPAPSVEDVYAGPIRGELLGAEHLADRARELAQGQRFIVDQRRRTMRRRPARLLIRLGQSRDLLEDAYARLAAAAGRGTDVGPAGDWLLDNFYVIREHISQVHESLPENYFRELPLLTHETLSEYPRVYELAITLISHTEGRIDLA